VNRDIVARPDRILKLPILSSPKYRRKISKLQTNGRSVISVETIAYRTFTNFEELEVADRHRLRISKAKTNNTK
jgi:hypothetical protein